MRNFLAGLIVGAGVLVGSIVVADETEMLDVSLDVLTERVEDHEERIERLEYHIECTEYLSSRPSYPVHAVDRCASRRPMR